ncbi:MAG: hypothetical protein PF495_14405, partial [Spirochaetales bacterium]|nr:hypothetical protein [Spirochaetales bacterium]
MWNGADVEEVKHYRIGLLADGGNRRYVLRLAEEYIPDKIDFFVKGVSPLVTFDAKFPPTSLGRVGPVALIFVPFRPLRWL